MKKKPSSNESEGLVRRFRFGKIAVTAAIYIGLAICLYQPSVKQYQPRLYIIMLNSIIAALGCFALSRRWISAYPGSIFAGIVYGFSPMALGFAMYHPLAGIPLAALPWLFCPAALWRKTHGHASLSTQRGRTSTAAIITAVLSLIPFVAIASFFWISANLPGFRVFPIPVQERLSFHNMAGIVVPLSLKPHDFIFGFYHVPLLALLMGLCMYVALGRPGIIVIVGVALVLAFSEPVLEVSPIIWSLVPLLFGSLLVGSGMQGLAWAGASDCKWILFCIVTTALVAAVCFWLAMTKGNAYLDAAIMHTLAVVLAGIIFFMAKAKLRYHGLRWALLCTGLGVDIIVTSTKLLAGVP